MNPTKYTIACILFAFCAINGRAQVSLDWARSSIGGGNSQIGVQKMKTDRSGNICTYGYFSGSILLDSANQTGQISTSGDYDYDIFFCRWDSTGNAIHTFTLAGSTNDTPTDFDIDRDGNYWLGGSFFGVIDLDPGPEECLLTSAGNTDLFLAKYSPDGMLLWAGQFGSPGYESGGQIATDSSGKVYFGGSFDMALDLDPGPGIFEVDPDGYGAFICTLDCDGNFLEAGLFEGSGYIHLQVLDTDAGGNLWCGGSHTGTADFDPGEGVFLLGSPDYSYCYIVKSDPQGNFETAFGYGGVEDISLENMVIDSRGYILTTGYFRDNADFDPGPGEYILNSMGLNDGYVLSLDLAGMLNRAVSISGESMESGKDIAVDEYDNVYVTGYFYGSLDADPGEGIYTMESAGDTDGFMLKLDMEGSFVWAKHLSSTSGISGNCLILNDDGSIIESGTFFSLADFDPAEPISIMQSTGWYDIFIRKLEHDLSVHVPAVKPLSSLKIWPNPGKGIFFAETTIPSVCRIYDMNGRQVFQSQLAAGINRINLSNLQPGVYAVQAISPEEVHVNKIQIRH
jgi:hypothetical protein